LLCYTLRHTTNICYHRPRVTISITAPGTQADSELLTLELPPGSTVKDLKGFIEAETGLPSASQGIYLNGQPVTQETQTLEDVGIRDGEMLAVIVRQNRQQAQQPRSNPRPAPVGQPDPEAVRQQVLRNPQAQAELRQRDPELLELMNDSGRWREAFAMRQQSAQNAERERQNQIALLNEDPFNVEAQRKIEELIRQERVVENLEKAYNENPEGEFTYMTQSHCSRAYVNSLCARPHALHQHGGQRRSGQGICRLRSPSHHHVT
jgi:DNA damage-inducible protein 1